MNNLKYQYFIQDGEHNTHSEHAEHEGHEGHHVNEFGVMLYVILFMMSVFNISSAYLAKKEIHLIHETSIIIGAIAFYSLDKMFNIDEQMFFYVLLPPILFAEGFNLQKERFFKVFGFALMYGALGTSLNFTFISICNHYINDFDHIKITNDSNVNNIGKVITFDNYDILLLSCVLSAKDSFAISTMIDHHKRPTLHDIIFGEGIFNDSTTLIIFNIIFGQRALINQQNSLFSHYGEILSHFFIDFFISVLIGLVHGVLAALSLKHFRFLRGSQMNEILIIFFFAYSSFVITEALHYSGVLSLMVAGIITGDYAWYNLSTKAKITSGLMFQIIAHASEGFMFFYLGVSLFWNLNKPWSSTLIYYQMLFIFIARFISIYGMSTIGYFVNGRKYALEWAEIFVLYCSGLMRGVLAYVLIEFVDDQDSNSHILITTVLGIVIIQTIVFGGLFPYVKDWALPMSHKEEHEQHEKALALERREHKALMYFEKGNMEYNEALFKNKWEYFWKKIGMFYIKPFLIDDYANHVKEYEIQKTLFKEQRWEFLRPDGDVNIKKLKTELHKKDGEEFTQHQKAMFNNYIHQEIDPMEFKKTNSNNQEEKPLDKDQEGELLNFGDEVKEEQASPDSEKNLEQETEQSKKDDKHDHYK